MGQRRKRAATAELVINAPAGKIFDILADPSKHPAIDGSGALRNAIEPPFRRLQLGATFTIAMRTFPRSIDLAQLLQALGSILNGGRITNTVVEFEEGRRIAWRHFGGHRWRYELEPFADRPDATLVRETFDYTRSQAPRLLELAGFPAKNTRAMEATLGRLKAFVMAAAARDPGPSGN